MVAQTHSNAFPKPPIGWFDLASLPGEQGGISMLMLNFIHLLMLNGLLVLTIPFFLQSFLASLGDGVDAPNGGTSFSCLFMLMLAFSSIYNMFMPKNLLNADFWYFFMFFTLVDHHLGFFFSFPSF